MSFRLSRQTLMLFGEFLESPKDWKYGYDISRSTGLKSGTLYPILMRLAEHKLLATSWEATEKGRPPRHLYRLTAEGLRFAREHASPKRVQSARRIAFGGVRA